jgi:hypothetical protein
MQSATSASGRKTRKGRTAPTVQPSTNFFNNDDIGHSSTQLRLQFLARLGLPADRASVIAALAWSIGGAA